MFALTLGPLGTIGHYILTPLYYAISGVMLAWHWLFTQIGLDPEGGASWALSIIGLTLVIRAALIPLFVKQIKASRNMQLIQPKVKELQKKYGHDRERLAQETMKLYKDSGTNPFASCLPILLQMPIFFALFRLIDQAAKNGTAHGFMTEEQARAVRRREAVRQAADLAASFTDSQGILAVQIVAACLVLAMTATTFTTQRQLMAKNMPQGRADRPLRPAAEDAALRAARGLRGRRHRVPDRRAPLLDHLEPVDDGAAVLRDPQQPGARAPRPPGEGGAGRARRPRRRAPSGDGGRRDAETADDDGGRGEADADRRPPQRQQPKRQSKSQRQAKTGRPSSGASPAGNQSSQNEKRNGNKQ